MKFRKSLRMPIGFLAGILFIWRAKPSLASFIIGTLFIFFGEFTRFVSSGTLKKFEVLHEMVSMHIQEIPFILGPFFWEPVPV